MGLACGMVAGLAGLEITEVTLRGYRADYWLGDKDLMLEVSGQESGDLATLCDEKSEQLANNPYGKDGYVCVANYLDAELGRGFLQLFLKRRTTMSSELIGEKSRLILRLEDAKRRKSTRDVFDLASKAAALEGKIARDLILADRDEDALINLISQATCFGDAKRFIEKERVLHFAAELAIEKGPRNGLRRNLKNRWKLPKPGIDLSPSLSIFRVTVGCEDPKRKPTRRLRSTFQIQVTITR